MIVTCTGRYLLSVQLVINRASGVALVGAGRDLTKLLFNRSLTNLYGNTWQGGKFEENGSANNLTVHSDWQNAPGKARVRRGRC